MVLSADIADAFFQMGVWFLQAGLHLQAEAAFLKACDTAPDQMEMHRRINDAYRLHGDHEGAVWHTKIALGAVSLEEFARERLSNAAFVSHRPPASVATEHPAPPRPFRMADYPFYPVTIPDIEIQPSLDMLLLELPPRYMPMMPYGIGYVHNILKSTGIRHQTVDCNIIMYHRFHARLIAGEIPPALPSGAPVSADCWGILNIGRWSDEEFVDFFSADIDEISEKVVAAAPRLLGISLNGQNFLTASRLVASVRRALPETMVLVGGHACVYHLVGPVLFPDFDYMFIGEAELTLPPLVASLLKGERPRDLPGVVSRFDSPNRPWREGPRPEDLDSVPFPTYDWTDIHVYRTSSGGHTVPIAAGRGCRWSRCTFCSERFAYRRRDPAKVLEEIEWMVGKGFSTFHFNESDVNADPELLASICEGIVRKNLPVRLMGQLRISRHNTPEYFRLLAAAGFTDLRFGVDAWSDHALKLQRKGYTMEMVDLNLRDCHAAGIRVAVNMIVGVPGETEEDVEEYIRAIWRNRKVISSLENVNTLILSHGSEYYDDPDRFGIRFRGDRDELYRRHVAAIPPEYWYSVDPYIDQTVRIRRMNHVVESVTSFGVRVGSYASQVIDTLNEACRG